MVRYGTSLYTKFAEGKPLMCTRGEQQEVAIQGDPGVSMKGAPHLGLPDFRVMDFKMWTSEWSQFA